MPGGWVDAETGVGGILGRFSLYSYVGINVHRFMNRGALRSILRRTYSISLVSCT